MSCEVSDKFGRCSVRRRRELVFQDDSPRSVASLKSVTVVRSGRTLLEVDNLTVTSGDFWTVLGANGAGKTTLLRILGALERPTSGVMHVLGERIGRNDLRGLRRRVGTVSPMLTDLFNLNFSLFDTVLTGTSGDLSPIWTTYGESERELVSEMLLQVGLYERRLDSVGLLSAGERQRLFLARALAAKPELLLLDEPASGLDFGAREDLLELLGRLMVQNEHLRAIVMVTHHVEEIPTVASHCALISSGRLNFAGNISEVLTAEALSETFSRNVALRAMGGRYFAMAES